MTTDLTVEPHGHPIDPERRARPIPAAHPGRSESPDQRPSLIADPVRLRILYASATWL